MAEHLIVAANLALLALVLLPAAAVLVSGLHAMFTHRRKRFDWVQIAGIGELPVLRE